MTEIDGELRRKCAERIFTPGPCVRQSVHPGVDDENSTPIGHSTRVTPVVGRRATQPRGLLYQARVTEGCSSPVLSNKRRTGSGVER